MKLPLPSANCLPFSKYKHLQKKLNLPKFRPNKFVKISLTIRRVILNFSHFQTNFRFLLLRMKLALPSANCLPSSKHKHMQRN